MFILNIESSSLVEICPVVLEKKFFLMSTMYFWYFVVISPWKNARSLICTNLKPSPFTQGCIVPNVIEIGSVVLKKIFKFRHFVFPTEDFSIIVLGKLSFFFHLDALWNFKIFLISEWILLNFFRAFVIRYRYLLPVTSYCPLKIFSGFSFRTKAKKVLKLENQIK